MIALFATLTHAADPVAALNAVLPSGNDGSISPTWAVEDFRAARAALGRTFARQLPAVLGTSVERHYWVASFLAEDVYLRGDVPDLSLAVKVLEDGLSHVRAVGDPEARVHLETKVSYLAALYAHALGDERRAAIHKARVQALLTADPRTASASVPAVEPNDRAAFDAIRTDRPAITD